MVVIYQMMDAFFYVVHKQWWIQDSRRGDVDPLGGHGPLMQVLFGKNLCKNERIGSLRGDVRRARPLDLPMIKIPCFFLYIQSDPLSSSLKYTEISR